MATWLKQADGAGIMIGPFVDSADGFTPLTSLTITASDVRISKFGLGTWEAKNESSAATHQENGWYLCALDDVDTSDAGRLIVAVHESGALPVWHEFLVVTAATYNSLVTGPAPLIVNAAASVWDEVAGDHQTPGSFGDTIGDIAESEFGVSIHPMVEAIRTTVNGLPSTAAEIADAVWDEATTDHTTTDTFGAKAGALTFTVAGAVDSNVEHVNGTEVTGSGTGGDPWGPA